MKKDIRAKVSIRGAVQGVGFRPFVFRLAVELGLRGWVRNDAGGVFMEMEGRPTCVEEFLSRLRRGKPPRAVIQSMETSFVESRGYHGIEIRQSVASGSRQALILPDIATCGDCLNEIFNPRDRRYHYPFTNCTNCGPRFSIMEALPYDRARTSMRVFTMCPACETEYNQPVDRRFHAQPNACPECGPRLQFLDAGGHVLEEGDRALLGAVLSIRAGKVIAVKALGGFQLLADARQEEVLRELRRRKQREEKPLAVMARDLARANELSRLSQAEELLLTAPEAPIVLLAARPDNGLAPSVAPGNPNIGIMLPSTPLHHLLMRELGFPVIATSGNVSGEPICIDNDEAVSRLQGIADCFLLHDRTIVRHVDDSVARVLLGGEQILRRARGYAPLPVYGNDRRTSVLAVGAHLKNAVALSNDCQIFVSQHIGDLDTPAAHAAFRSVCRDLPELYGVMPEVVARDLHPDYLSSKHAADLGTNVVAVQHHWAHVCSCMVENELDPPVLGLAWDGTGYGADGTIWGGEFLLPQGGSFSRVAHFRTFKLPGGEAAIREPRRCALGLLYEIAGDALFDCPERPPLCHFEKNERALLRQALARGVNAPVTSSIGRLFDAVASLSGLRQRVAYEGQAAMELEFAANGVADNAYACELTGRDPVVIDWEPMLLEILRDVQACFSPGVIAMKFHLALVEAALAVARRIGLERVVLSGGCFQNRFLTERLVQRLREEGFRPYWQQRVPCNDGGIALGQVAAAAWQLKAQQTQVSNVSQKESFHVSSHSR